MLLVLSIFPQSSSLGLLASSWVEYKLAEADDEILFRSWYNASYYNLPDVNADTLQTVQMGKFGCTLEILKKRQGWVPQN